MSSNLLPITSYGGFISGGEISYAGTASPAPSINGFDSATFSGTVTTGNLLLTSSYIKSGIPTVVNDGINSISTGVTTTMDVFGFPFSISTRGQLTISGDITPIEALGTWYYQALNTNTFEIYTDDTYSTPVNSTTWAAYSGGGSVAITKLLPAANLVVDTNGFFTTFDDTGQVKLSGNLILSGNTFTVNYANGEQVSLGGATPNSLANSSALFTLMSDNTLLSGNSTSPQNFKVNDVYTPDVDLRNASGTGMFTQGTNLTIRTSGTYNWNLTDSGNLSAPGSVLVKATNGNLVLGDATATSSPGLSSTSSVTITANRDGTAKSMVFDTGGNLVLTGNITANNLGNIASINKDSNASNVLFGNGAFAASSSIRANLLPDTFITAIQSGSTQLTSSMYRMIFTVSGVTSYTITLPDTNTCYVGQSFVLVSASQNYTYLINMFGGSAYTTWTPGVTFILTVKTQRGLSSESVNNWSLSYQGGYLPSGSGQMIMSKTPTITDPTLSGNVTSSGTLTTRQTAQNLSTWSYNITTQGASSTNIVGPTSLNFSSLSGLATGQAVTITGTPSGTGSWPSYISGQTYYVVGAVSQSGATSISLASVRNTGSILAMNTGTFTGLTLNFAPTVAINMFSNGQVVNATISPSSNFDVSITYQYLAAQVYTATLIINQGSTPRMISDLFFASYGSYSGLPQTVNWEDGVTPTGNANKKDVITFTWIPSSSTDATVFASLKTYG